METKGVFWQIALFTNRSLELLDAVIVTSDDDEAVGKACPIYGQTEIVAMDISNTARTMGDWAGDEQHAWFVKGGACAACRSFWMLLDNGAGRRMVIYERKSMKTAGDYPGELKNGGRLLWLSDQRTFLRLPALPLIAILSRKAD
jgi:hypothetical protein